MKYKLFGKNITPSCGYCENSLFSNGAASCKKGRSITDNKCRYFAYDPLMRVPRSVTLRGTYTAEDFKL